MSRVAFVVPVHGRLELTRVCLRQLRRTCDAAHDAFGVDATAIIVGDDPSLDVADQLGFATVRRDNTFLGRKFNDGFELATNPAVNPAPADYVIPCGSDDWIDPALLGRLPDPSTIGIFRRLAYVNEARTELMPAVVAYKTAAGPKIIPAGLVARARYRPAEESRRRAIDASTMEGIKRALGYWPKTVELDQHDRQIVDWKTAGEQLNTYGMVRGHRRGAALEPFAALAGLFPDEALDEIRAITPLEAAA